jgi:hypothetical protein
MCYGPPKIGTVAADFRQSLVAGAEHGQDDERFRVLDGRAIEPKNRFPLFLIALQTSAYGGAPEPLMISPCSA